MVPRPAVSNKHMVLSNEQLAMTEDAVRIRTRHRSRDTSRTCAFVVDCNTGHIAAMSVERLNHLSITRVPQLPVRITEYFNV